MAEHRIGRQKILQRYLYHKLQNKAINRREMLRKHFPDWEERMDYQKKQEKNLSIWSSSN
jgi:hypothetical protein